MNNDPRGRRPVSDRDIMRKNVRPSRRRPFKPNLAVVLVVLVFVSVIAICVGFALSRKNAPETVLDTALVKTSDTAAQETENADKASAEAGFSLVTVDNEDMHNGDLILVNYKYAYTFPEDNDITGIYDIKSSSYKVNNTETSMAKHVTEAFNTLMDDFYAYSACGDMMIVSGFRDYDSQKRIFDDRVQTEGAEEAAKYVALPGYSEHHTGLAMDLTVYLSDGSSYYVADYPDCRWFEEHAFEYGFVLRYPTDKADITKISYESWHYRYVGTVHSQIMTERSMCLEEYVDFLESFKYGESYLVYSNAKGSVEAASIPEKGTADAVVYFVPASAGETTDIPVPDGWSYEISGDNVGGFVVTARENTK